MGKKILFSPIGGTDPIKYFRDGSMLHICRHYKPDVVHMYMSHEMLEYHKKDNRYVDALERLGVYLNHSFEVHLIERDALVEVQQYDVFYQIFREELAKIESRMEDGDELLLNMSSGTPAMKSALFVLATFAEYRFKPIQVSTPKKGMNEEHEERKEYDNEANWELNEDNSGDAPNRCMEVKSLNLMRMIQVENIKKHVMAYDYVAALAIANEIKEHISEEAFTWLQIMEARVKLNHQKISKLTRGGNFDVYPVKTGDKRTIFEYALVLQMELEKQEYANFIRGITPLVVDLMEGILKNKCGISLEDCCSKDKNGIMRWSPKKLRQIGLDEVLENAYRNSGGFKYGPVYSSQIAKLVECRCPEKRVIETVNEMMEVEGNARNIAAHSIVSVTEEWFKERTGKSTREILKLMKELVEMAGINVKKEDWRSYDKVNEKIARWLN